MTTTIPPTAAALVVEQDGEAYVLVPNYNSVDEHVPPNALLVTAILHRLNIDQEWGKELQEWFLAQLEKSRKEDESAYHAEGE